MINEVRIPTLLGLGVLIAGLALGVFLVVQNQSTLFVKASPSLTPKSVVVSNVSANSATISWQTDEATPGFIRAGISDRLGLTFNDDRDLTGPSSHLLHFVTLKNLIPDATYYFKLTSGASVYPKQQPLTFKTSKALQPQSYQPIIGQIVDTNFKEVEEALIFLQIEGAQPLAAITKQQGKFILPLADLKAADLTSIFKLESTLTTLTIISPTQTSTVTLTLPLDDPLLPPIILGKNMQISPKVASPSALTTPSASPKSQIINYDLNRDGKVNSLDYSVLVDNLGNQPKNEEADLNGDRVVDRKDLDLMNKYLSNLR